MLFPSHILWIEQTNWPTHIEQPIQKCFWDTIFKTEFEVASPQKLNRILYDFQGIISVLNTYECHG